MEGFKDLFQGGDCNPNLQQNNSNNQFKNFMNNMSLNTQQINQIQQGNFQKSMTNKMQNFENAWNQGQKGYVNQQDANVRRVEMMQKMWQMQQQQRSMNNMKTIPIFQQNTSMKVQEQIRPWSNFVVPQMPMNPQEKLKKEYKEFTIEETKTEQEDHQSSHELIELMENDPDSKFQESNFLDFLKNVRNKKFEIKENKLIVNEKAKISEEEIIKNMTYNYETYIRDQINLENNIEAHLNQANEQGQNMFNDIVQEKETIEEIIKGEKEEEVHIHAQPQSKMENMWKDLMDNYKEDDPKMKDKLEDIWKESIKNYEEFGDEEYLVKAWQASNDLEEMQYANFNETYDFKKDNKNIDLENPIEKLPEILRNGNLIQTIDILEAHLQKHPDDYQGWKALGMIHQEMDKDQPSVACFLNSLKYNPQDLSSLLQLGVSCTNILDQVHAMNFIDRWLESNTFYKKHLESISIGRVISEESLKKDEFTTEEIVKINQKMKEKFTKIEQMTKTNDTDLMNCLAVLHFISSDYTKALHYFKKALEKDPNNYSVLNKVGATYALLKNTNEALQYYHKSLSLKPNFTRGWANLAINYNINKNSKQATSFLLNSIALNPQARHLWSYLESIFITTKDKDSIFKMKDFNLNQFKDKHNVHGFSDLPAPDGMSYIEMFEKYNLTGSMDQWIKKYEVQSKKLPTKDKGELITEN